MAALAALMLCAAKVVLAQNLDENCTVSVLNRTVRVNHDGSWVLPNVPANFGQIKARATCVRNGLTTSGESAFFTVPANGAVNLPAIVLGSATQIPASVSMAPANPSFTVVGQTTQLAVTAAYPDNSTRNVTAGSTGTNYTTSNSAIATVNANGLVTAIASGTVVIQATNDGASGITTASVVLSNVDSDGDGIPDDVEISLGLDPHNPVDAQEDFDRDGLTNLREFQLGTGLRVFDTDGDGIGDGLEVQTGSNPLDPNSFNLAQTLQSIQATPTNIVLLVNTIIGEASRQLTVTGRLIDGNFINLTSTSRGTNYSSSDLDVANFGEVDGLVFAGSDGFAFITVSNSGFTAPAVGVTVTSFAPTALSFVSIPGFANNVDVSGNFAYVAAGSAGLQVVDVTDRRSPHIVGSLDTPGNANDVKVVGTRAYVADGSAGLQIIDITNPNNPTLLGALDTPGEANDVVVVGNRAYVADGEAGLQIIDVSDPQTPRLLGTYSATGFAKAVDITGNIAVVAYSTGGVSPEGRAIKAAGRKTKSRVRTKEVGVDENGIRTVNVSDPGKLIGLGSLATTGARDVIVDGDTAYVADFTGSLNVVDISDPAAPQLLATTPTELGGILMDVKKAQDFVFGADVFFVNGVPIVNVSDPANPSVRARLDFPARDDNGTGIAVDNTYVYLTADESLEENGVSGDSRLYIGQYVALEDRAGISPVVSITSPSVGTTVIEGSTLLITVQATDDVQVAAVSFLVNGNVVFTDSAAPYQFSLTVPSKVATLTLGAKATDVGNNEGVAQNVQVNVAPDPKTTVVGRVLDAVSNPVQGATVATNGQHTATTNVDGTFSIAGVPTILGDIVVNATATVDDVQLRGTSASVAPVPGGQTDVGDVIVRPGRLFGVAFNGPSGPSTLYSIDHTTGVATAIGPIGFNAVSAMDFDASGTLYAVGRRPAGGELGKGGGGGGVSVLMTINTTTGVGTEIGPTGVEKLGFGDSVSDISFRNSAGALYAYLESGDGVGTIDILTGAITALGSSGVGCCGNGIAFSPEDVLFHTNESELHTLDQATGQATFVAPMIFPVPSIDFPRINAMDYQPGTGILFGSLLTRVEGTRVTYLVTVDTATGVVTIVGHTIAFLDAIAFK